MSVSPAETQMEETLWQGKLDAGQRPSDLSWFQWAHLNGKTELRENSADDSELCIAVKEL